MSDSIGEPRAGEELDESDAQRLAVVGLPFVGSANAHFIVRNMGGDALKCDRWLAAFLHHFRIRQEELASQLRRLSIPPGLFDLVLWAYCEAHVGRVANFRQHFRALYQQ